MLWYIILLFFTIRAEILKLTNTTIDQAIEASPIIVIKYYAEWCRFSKVFEPEYVKAAIELERKGCIVAEIEVDKHKEVMERYDITGYPTVMLYYKKKEYEFTGKQTAERLIEFVERKINPVSKELNSVEEIQKVKAENASHSCIAVIDNLGEYTKIVQSLTEYQFYHTTKELFSRAFPENPRASVAAIINERQALLEMPQIDFRIIEDFLLDELIPIVSYINFRVINGIFRNKHRALFVLYRDEVDDNREFMDNSLEKVASRFFAPLRSVYFVKSGLDEGYGRILAKQFNLQSHELPIAEIIQFGETVRRYRFKGMVYSESELLKFYRDWQQGLIPELTSHKK